MSGSSYWPMSAVYVHGTAPFSRIHATAMEVSRPPEKAIPTRSPMGREFSTLDTSAIICTAVHDHATPTCRSQRVIRTGQPRGSLASAVIEQGGAEHGVGGGELGGVDAVADLAVELPDDADHGPGVLLARRGQDHVELTRVIRIPPGHRVPPLYQAGGHLPRGLPGHAQHRTQPAHGHGAPAQQQPDGGRVAAAVVRIAGLGEATGHRAEPALPGQREQVAEWIKRR